MAEKQLAFGRKRLGYVWSLNPAHEEECNCENLVGFYGSDETLPMRPHPNCYCDIQPFYKLTDEMITEALGQYVAKNYAVGHHPNQYVRGRGPQPPQPTGPISVQTTPRQLHVQQMFAGIPIGGSPNGSGTVHDPIAVGHDLELAAKLIGEGKHVRINTPREVSILVSQLAKNIELARAKGESLTYDMCKITIEGKSLFCVESKDIPRVKMPQLKGVPKPGSPGDKLPKDKKGEIDGSKLFVKLLEKNGIKVKKEKIPVDQLKASQNQLDIEKVNAAAEKMEAGKVYDTPIFTTKDGYIIDGHHRWAASIIYGIRTGNKAVSVKSRVLDLDIGAGLSFAQHFANYLGLGGVDIGTTAPPKPTPPKQLALIEEILEKYTAQNYQPGHHPNQYVKGKPKQLKSKLASNVEVVNEIKLPGGFEEGDVIFSEPPLKEEYAEYTENPSGDRVILTDVLGDKWRAGTIIEVDFLNKGFWVRDPDTGDEWFAYRKDSKKRIMITESGYAKETGRERAKLGEGEDISDAINKAIFSEDVGFLLEEFFKQKNVVMAVPLHGMSIENARGIGKALIDFDKEFPEITKDIAYYGTTATKTANWDHPAVKGKPHVRYALKAVVMIQPGTYAQTTSNPYDEYGNTHTNKHVVGFNHNIFAKTQDAEKRYFVDVLMEFHPPKPEEFTAAEAVGIHELGHVFNNAVQSTSAYNHWGDRNELNPEKLKYVVSQYAEQSGAERFAEAYMDYRTNGLNTTGTEDQQKNGDTATMAKIIDTYADIKKRRAEMLNPTFKTPPKRRRKRKAPITELAFSVLQEKYTARTYTPGHHPNQYIKGRPKQQAEPERERIKISTDPEMVEIVQETTRNELLRLAERELLFEQAEAKEKAEIPIPPEKIAQKAAELSIQVEKDMENFTKDADVVMRVPPDVLLEILDGDRFKNQIESGDSRGAFNPSYRMKIEEKAFGIPHSPLVPPEEPDDYPKYGYFEHRESPNNHVSQYGSIKVVFKPEVRDRTTVTFGDSLNGMGSSIMYPGDPDRPSVYNIAYTDLQEFTFVEKGQSKSPDQVNRDLWYVEAQIHGELTLDDVQEVVFTKGRDMRAPAFSYSSGDDTHEELIEKLGNFKHIKVTNASNEPVDLTKVKLSWDE